MDSEWVPPGPGFSEDWLGFRRSFTKRPSGRHYAQCKYCGTIMDGRLPSMRKHKITCDLFGSAQEIMPNDTYYETTEQEEETIEEEHTEYVDGDNLTQEIVHMKSEEVHLKNEPTPVKRKRGLGKKPVRISHHHHQQQQQQQQPQPVQSPTIYETYQSPSPAAAKSRFAEAVRVWERKLDDLPVAQALQIEKSINDMLYEAALANIQQTHQPAVIKVNIAPHGLDHEG